jgi:hypothetical protein
MSLYMDLASAPAGSQVFVRYRKATEDPANSAVWRQGYPLWYDARTTNPGCSGECQLPYTSANGVQRARGSVVNLEPGTKYVFELGTGSDYATANWQWHLDGTTWAQTPDRGWPQTLVQDGAAIAIPNASGACPSGGPCVISQGGSAATGYKVYDGCQSYQGSVCTVKGEINRGGSNTTAARTDPLSHGITINASFVVVRNIRVTGAAISGIYVTPGTTNVVIEDSQIDDWAHRPGDPAGGNPNPNSWSTPEFWGYNHAAGVYLAGNNSRVVVQRTVIKEPRYGSFPWDTQLPDGSISCDRLNPGSRNHPLGPLGIHVTSGGRQNVIRYNEITGDAAKKKWYLDGIGGGENFSAQGSPGADSDIYQNIVMHVFDDAIETEGGGRNVRVWGNYVSEAKTAVATSVVHFGPFYAWRNVVNHVRYCHQQASQQDDFFSAAFKLAGRKGNNDQWGDGIRYLFHNTLLQEPGAGIYAQGSGKGIESDGNGVASARFTVGLNNIFHVRIDCIPRTDECRWAWSIDSGTEGGNPPTGALFAYDLYNGRHDDVPIGVGFQFSWNELSYMTGHGALSVPALGGSGQGNYQLATGSTGRDICAFLPNFSDGYGDSAPDCGAHEAGSPPMRFGIGAGQ